MYFRVIGRRAAYSPPTRFPTLTLKRDGWNDYGFETMFSATLQLSAKDEPVELDDVKILRRGQPGGQVEVPTRFEALSDDFCSLGQSTSYYEALSGMGSDVWEPLLVALRDVALMSEVAESFRSEPGFATSLLRFSPAERALEYGREVLRAPAERTKGELGFTYVAPGNSRPITFRFGRPRELPNRVIALIGYNGVGKTRLLANIGMVAASERAAVRDATFLSRHGRFKAPEPSFGAVISVSYSAFDDFEIPGEGTSVDARQERARAKAGRTNARRYEYCGLRQVKNNGQVSTELKDLQAITTDFQLGRALASKRKRMHTLEAALQTLAAEPSFRLAADGVPTLTGTDQDWASAFSTASTGHKIALNVVTQLCARLEQGALVLIDEPEMHLHPPLVAALLRAISGLLEHFDAYAIMATHSPVVAQEIPAANILIVQRTGTATSVAPPVIETYGEEVGALTAHVFALDSRVTDFRGVLEALAADHDMEWFEALFEERGMSPQVRAIVLGYQMRMGLGDAET